MKSKALPFRCVSRQESEVFINLKAVSPTRILGVVIVDKAKKDFTGATIANNIKKGEAKIRNLPREAVKDLRQWRLVKILDLLTKCEWILEVKVYRYAAGRLDSHERLIWRLVAYPSAKPLPPLPP